MRDRNASRKRASLKEQDKISINGAHNIYNDSLAYPPASDNSYRVHSAHSSKASTSPPASTSSRLSANPADPRRLVDLFYKYANPVAVVCMS